MMSAKARKRLINLFLNLLTALLALGWASLIVWAVVVSFRPASEPLGRGDVWFGHHLTLANYLKALSLAPFGIYYRNTLIIVGMILAVQFGSAFGTFLMRQAFLEVPRDLVDAGIIDGCSWWQLLWHVYLPPSIPTLIAFALSSLTWHWNEFLWPLVVTLSEKSRPLTIGLVRFTQLGEIGARWPLLAAATLIVVGPLLVLFLLFQRQFIRKSSTPA